MNYVAIVALILCLIFGAEKVMTRSWVWVVFYTILTLINIYSIIRGVA